MTLANKVLRLVVVAKDQTLLAHQARHMLVQPTLLVHPEDNITKVVDRVARLDALVPTLDHYLVHLLNTIKVSATD